MDDLTKRPAPIAENKFFKAYRIFKDGREVDGVTCISGLAGELCYLIEGSERALLIDGLTGVGSLKAFVRELTDLPVSLALTHGHIDHAGMAWETGECYINPDDIALIYQPSNANPENRFSFATGMGRGTQNTTHAVLADACPPSALKTYPIYTEDIFDLGGTQIEVIQVPGHTYGTVVYLDRARRIVYSGDACNANTLVGLAGSTTIEEYLESLNFFKTYQKDFDVMYGGHGMNAVPNTIIDDAITLCEDIIAGRADDIPNPTMGGEGSLLALKRGANFLPERGGLCDIVYRKDMVKKRPHPVIKGEPILYK